MTNNDDAKKAADKKAAEKKAAEKRAAEKRAAEAKKAEEAKKASEGAAKKPAGAKKLPERPKAQASASGSKPAARSMKLGAFQPLKGTFNKTSGKDEWTPYAPDSREFILLADSYNLGMRILERSDATAKLVELGHECVKDWKIRAEDTGYHWSGDESKMTEYVSYFLEKYRNESTRLDVSARPIRDAYAETVFDMAYGLPDLFHLDPKALTQVVLDKQLFGQVVENDAERVKLFASGAQKNVKDLKAFAQARKHSADLGLLHQALLGAIMFHELAHCFVFYLGMNGEPNTPPDLKGPEVSLRGEAGAWLEDQVLGGTLVMKDDALYLVDKASQGREVDMTRMNQFVTKPETFDLRSGLPLKPNGRTCVIKDTRRSPSPSPDTRQRAMFAVAKKHARAYDVYLGRDENGVAIHASSPRAVTVAS